MEETNIACRRCQSGVAIRISRIGFLQRRVLNLLGIYPWKCGACGCIFLFPKRGHGVRTRRSSGRDADTADAPSPRNPELAAPASGNRL